MCTCVRERGGGRGVVVCTCVREKGEAEGVMELQWIRLLLLQPLLLSHVAFVCSGAHAVERTVEVVSRRHGVRSDYFMPDSDYFTSDCFFLSDELMSLC